MVEHRAEVDDACGQLRELLNETRSLGRRDFIKALGNVTAQSALLSSAAPLLFGTPAAATEKPVTAFVFGGSWKSTMKQALFDPFTKKSGIPVVYQEPYTFPKLRAMHEAKAQEIDLVCMQGGELIIAERMNMLTPLDWSMIDRSVLSERQLHHPNVIGAFALSMVITYNKKTWPGDDHPKSWADFWNVEKYPGRRALRRDAGWMLEVALMADGVKENEFYPLDADRAFRSLDRIKPHVKAWWSDNSQAQQLIEQEEVDLIAAMNGRATESISNGAPFEMVWNEAVCTGNNNGWLIPVGSPNPQGAMKFMDLAGRPEPLAVIARLIYYSPQNLKAFDLIDEALAKQLPTYPANEKIAHTLNYDWWADNLTAMQRRFEAWLQT